MTNDTHVKNIFFVVISTINTYKNMSPSVVGGEKRNAGESQQTQGVKKTIYFGIFFDGTNNNKYQVMLGKLFRNTEAISKKVKDGKGREYSISQIRSMGRAYWEKQAGGFSKSELDEIFFGYEDIGETYFIENSTHHAATQEAPMYSSNEAIAADKFFTNVYDQGQKEFEREANRGVSDKGWKQLKDSKGEGGAVQGVTYTNVAILEALYQESEDHYPIYIEGVGTELGSGSRHKIDAATGKGDTGLWAKVRTMAASVSRICFRYERDKDVSELAVHMSVYGFSRGATSARMFSFIVNPINKYDTSGALKQMNESSFLSYNKIKEKKLEFAGIFDTVATFGVAAHGKDVDQLYLYGVDNAEYVLHLCAMDEFRTNFALTDINSAFSKGLELFLPGCHTDVGGGISLGVDDWKQINKLGSIISKWGRNNPSEYAPVNEMSLREMGWITPAGKAVNGVTRNFSESRTEESGSLFREEVDFIEIRKYVQPGYSNVPLALMHAKAKEKLVPFKDIPPSYQLNYPFLKRMYDSWSKSLGQQGQQFVAIGKTDYSFLRSYFLHFSGNESPSLDGVVNGIHKNNVYLPGKNILDRLKSLITRIIYVGDDISVTEKYELSDLHGNPG